MEESRFWHSSFFYVTTRINGFEKEKEREWLHTREIIASVYNTVVKEKKKGRDLIPLSFDKPTERIELSDEQKRIIAKIARANGGQGR
jgi:hypothetical protein